MGWSTPIDAYCERLDPSFWAEPVNAVTNAAFLAAAVYGLVLALRGRDGWLGLLAAVAAAVGIGSFLFHTVATRWAALADVIPIGLFIALGFALVMRRAAGLSVLGAGLATLAFLGLSPVVAMAGAPFLGSSSAYLPALLALVSVGRGLVAAGVPAGRPLLAAGAVFAVSLAFRMADGPLCGSIAVGTHFGWHLLNGVVLALVIAAVARSAARIG
jgi:hypothetical protein